MFIFRRLKNSLLTFDSELVGLGLVLLKISLLVTQLLL